MNEKPLYVEINQTVDGKRIRRIVPVDTAEEGFDILYRETPPDLMADKTVCFVVKPEGFSHNTISNSGRTKERKPWACQLSSIVLLA